jgi:hypothetical protein
LVVPPLLSESRAFDEIQSAEHNYSSYGQVEKLAQEIAAGAREEGATVEIKLVPELVSLDVAKAANYKLDQSAPVVKIEELTRLNRHSPAEHGSEDTAIQLAADARRRSIQSDAAPLFSG